MSAPKISATGLRKNQKESQTEPQLRLTKKRRSHRNFQRQQQLHRQVQQKNIFGFKTPILNISVENLLISIVYCYLTYFLLCIFSKFVNFLSNEYYFIIFLIILFGFMILSLKKKFSVL
jgi:hypothetical protein